MDNIRILQVSFSRGEGFHLVASGILKRDMEFTVVKDGSSYYGVSDFKYSGGQLFLVGKSIEGGIQFAIFKDWIQIKKPNSAAEALTDDYVRGRNKAEGHYTMFAHRSDVGKKYIGEIGRTGRSTTYEISFREKQIGNLNPFAADGVQITFCRLPKERTPLLKEYLNKETLELLGKA